MNILYVACLHNPEDFEKWLMPYLSEKNSLFPFDYRVIHLKYDCNKALLDMVKDANIDKVLLMKGELITSDTINKLNELGVDSACWTIDDQEHPEQFKKPFTTIFTPAVGLIEDYKRRGYRNVYELPFYAEPKICENIQPLPEPPEASILGTAYEGREEKITYLRENSIDVKVYGDQWKIPNRGRLHEYTDCLRLWKSSKINLNIHQKNMRRLSVPNTKMFEVPAAGGFLLTDDFPELYNKFTKDELAAYEYDSRESLLDKVRYYLDNDGLRNEIALKARERVIRDHSAKNRAEYILSKL